MRWPTPVRPGDTLSGRLTIGASRPSQSRPDIGFVDTPAAALGVQVDAPGITLQVVDPASSPPFADALRSALQEIGLRVNLVSDDRTPPDAVSVVVGPRF